MVFVYGSFCSGKNLRFLQMVCMKGVLDYEKVV